jgi:hypothetical protein
MSMFNMFSSCFIWLLCILLIAVSFIYLSQKISEQNHKMSSMIGLISSMANELQHSKPDTKHINHPIIELSDLINVSEDEECEDDDDDDDDDDIDENSDDENSDDGDDKNEKSDDEKSDDEKSDDEKSDEKSTDCNKFLDIDIMDINGDIDISNIEITNIDAVDTKIKSIHITESLEEKINYKKMKIDQLKTIVTQKGLGDAAFISKFKKDDLIKLLSE